MGKLQGPNFIEYQGNPTAELKKVGDKYVMEFDDVPALIFVSFDGAGVTDKLFRFGEWMTDVRNYKIESDVQGMTTFDVSRYAAGVKWGD